MKGVYWRPRYIPQTGLVFIALLAVGGFVCVELFPSREQSGYYAEQRQASQLALKAMAVLKKERLKIDPAIDPQVDPAETGLIGPMISPVTSEPGSLEAKQGALNPNFAALTVHFLKRAGVKPGDTVAVGYTGSFPGLNIALCAALQVLKVKPVVISTASSSEWGATHPDFLWLDMERILYEHGLIGFRSVSASLGGANDSGAGIPRKGRELLAAGIRRNGVPLLPSRNLEESITLRMHKYQEHSSAITVYINVGGGVASLGGRESRAGFPPGFNRHLPPKREHRDSVMLRFLLQKVPGINLLEVDKLGTRHGLDLQFTTLPAAGEGEVYYRRRHNPWLAAAVLALIVASLFGFFRSDWGFRVLQTTERKKEGIPPEPMI